LLAEFLDNRSTFDCFLAAVATVVIAAAVIVLVVAVAISFVIRELTNPFAVGVALIIRVQTFASLAILGVDRAAFDCFFAAVATVPLAAAVIVLVVAVAIPLVIRELTAPFTVGVALIIRVQTFASLAIL